MLNKALVYGFHPKLFVYNIMSFGDWLRERINESGWSNAELARRADLSPTYIGNLLRDFSPNTKTGKGRPSEEAAEAIARALGRNIDEARLAAGYSARNGGADPDGFYRDINKLPPDAQRLARKQVRSILDALAEEESPDIDYIDDQEIERR